MTASDGPSGYIVRGRTFSLGAAYTLLRKRALSALSALLRLPRRVDLRRGCALGAIDNIRSLLHPGPTMASSWALRVHVSLASVLGILGAYASSRL